MTAQLPTRRPPLKVLLATARYFPYVGGTETHVYEVARRLVQNGVDVTVLTTDPSRALPQDETIEGVRIRRVPSWPAREDYYFAPDVYNFAIEGDWDVIHCQGCHTFVPPLAMLAGLRRQIPYVVTFHLGGHSSRLRNSLRGIQWTVLGPLLKRASCLVAVSHFEAKFFQTRLNLEADRFVYIPNGSNLPAVTGDSSADGGDTLITSVGRLERYKGHHRVIAALPHVLQQRPDVRLRIVGSGPHEALLREQAREIGVADRVEIGAIPASDREGMARVLSRSSLVTLLSEAESNPVAVMEAVALGRSVLVANGTGLRDLAERGLVRAIPLESTDAEVGDAILNQLSHPFVPPPIELPTWDGCARNVLDVYYSVLRGNSCGS
ncbi:MAG: glycosyltransferase family 4 protein [Anaerolineae bacterium]